MRVVVFRGGFAFFEGDRLLRVVPATDLPPAPRPEKFLCGHDGPQEKKPGRLFCPDCVARRRVSN